MGTSRKTITLTTQQNAWIKKQIANGAYTNDSEYIRDLVQRDQQRNADIQQLKQAIQEGLDSGVSNDTLHDIWDQAERRYLNING